MEHLHTFSHAGVRSPAPLVCIESGSTSILIMERLHAVNVQHILNGTASLPEGFEYEVFYDAISDYLDKLHKTKGVAHNDLFPRNFMIDLKTSMPYVIDFGRAAKITAHEGVPFVAATKDDWDKYDELYEELEKYRNKEELKVREIVGRHEEFILSHVPHIHYSASVITQAEQFATKGMTPDEVLSLHVGEASGIAVSRDGSKITGALQFVHNGITYYVGKVTGKAT